MPKRLYWRAALILILPVVLIQLLVSFVFIQRHFEGVTEQMSRSVALELRYLLDQMQRQPSQGQALDAVREVSSSLRYDLAFISQDQIPPASERRWYDFSGIVVLRTLDQELDELRILDLPDDYRIIAYLESDLGFLQIGFDRPRVSATNPH